jgi:hypothetical protein
MMMTGYLIRYLGLAVVAIALVQIIDTYVIAFFMGYFGLKVAALTQPLTHKMYNAIFHEVDPIPEPMPLEEEKESNLD